MQRYGQFWLLKHCFRAIYQPHSHHIEAAYLCSVSDSSQLLLSGGLLAHPPPKANNWCHCSAALHNSQLNSLARGLSAVNAHARDNRWGWDGGAGEAGEGESSGRWTHRSDEWATHICIWFRRMLVIDLKLIRKKLMKIRHHQRGWRPGQQAKA